MESDTWILFAVLVSLIVLGGYFASSEIAFASVNKFKIKIEADHGNVKAIRALYIIENFEDTLTTLLVGNNIAHIFAAATATLITTKLWGQWAVIYSTFVMTIIVFLISETIPKVVAKSHSYKYALALSDSLYALMKLMTPVNFILTKISAFLIKILSPKSSITISKQDIERMVESMPYTESQGKNKELFKFALNFGETKAEQIVTEKSKIVGVSLGSNREAVIETIMNTTHSRLPVYIDDIDNIIGVIQVRKYLKAIDNGDAKPSLKELMDKPLFITGDTPIDDVFRKMNINKVNMAIVADDRRNTYGLLTVEDILEQLVGEIWDEDESDYVAAEAGGVADGN